MKFVSDLKELFNPTEFLHVPQWAISTPYQAKLAGGPKLANLPTQWDISTPYQVELAGGPETS
jgi:hypothetical protein